MNYIWVSAMIILGVIFVITIVFICIKCMKDYKHIKNLISNDLPQNNATNNTLTDNNIRTNQVYPIPVATGVEVYGVPVNSQVIDVNPEVSFIGNV